MDGKALPAILYVDDEQENLDGFAFTFRKYFKVLLARSGEVALDILEANPGVKILLADQRMPGMTGIQLIDKVSKKWPGIVRLMLTAYTDTETIIEALNKGHVYRFITKPWQKHELLTTINNALESYDLKQANNQLVSDLKSTNIELEEHRNNLEKLVQERTRELELANKKLFEKNVQLEEAGQEYERLNNQLLNVISSLKETERSLEESEEKLQKFIDQSYDGISILDERGKIIEWNPAMHRMFGYQKEEVLGMYIADWEIQTALKSEMNDEKKEFIRREVNEFISKVDKGKPFHVEGKKQNKSGEDVYYNLTVFPIITSYGNFVGRITRDVTKNKLAEQELQKYRGHLEELVQERTEKLKESERNYREIFNSTNDAIFIHDAESGEILDVNQTMLDMYEMTREEAFSINLGETSDYQSGFTTEKGLHYVRKAVEKGPQLFEWRAKTFKSKRTFWTEVVLKSAVIGGKKRVLAMVRDIDNRKKAEEIAQESELHYQELFEHAVEGIITLNSKNNILDANSSICRLLGYSRDELISRDFHSMLKLFEPSKELEKQFESGNGKVVSLETAIKTKTGNHVFVDISGKRIADGTMQLFIRDLTEKKEMERALLEAIINTEEKEREKFARNLHDDLGPLLSSIKMYINSLPEVTEDEKRAYIIKQVNIILKEAILSTKEISNDLSPHVLVNYGVGSALTNYFDKAGSKIDIQFLSNIEEKRFSDSIETNLFRICKELVNNTIKHAGATKIKVVLDENEQGLLLEYEDNGKGIDNEDNMNTGMGIHNIKNRVNMLNGKISFYKPGQGGFGVKLNVPLKT